MPGTANKVTVGGVERLKFFQQFDAPGTTGPEIRFSGGVTVQIAGTATNIVAIVERASQDPGSGNEDWAPVEAETFSGNLSLGLPPRAYLEPADGWWRVRVTNLTGGHARVSIVGDDI